jgi:hypothetical protein
MAFLEKFTVFDFHRRCLLYVEFIFCGHEAYVDAVVLCVSLQEDQRMLNALTVTEVVSR